MRSTIETGTTFAQEFNSGYLLGVKYFEIHVTSLALIFGLRIILNFPIVRDKVARPTKYNLKESLDHALDISAFFLVALMFYGLKTGKVVN